MFKQLIKNNRGLTLIEIIVVMAIIALFTSLVATQVTGRLEKAKVQSTQTQMKMLEQSLQLYKADNDYYPTTEQGLDALIAKPTIGNIPQNYPEEGYLAKKSLPKDGWKRPFIYISEDGTSFTIISYGADNKEGGTGKGADLTSDDL